MSFRNSLWYHGSVKMSSFCIINLNKSKPTQDILFLSVLKKKKVKMHNEAQDISSTG